MGFQIVDLVNWRSYEDQNHEVGREKEKKTKKINCSPSDLWVCVVLLRVSLDMPVTLTNLMAAVKWKAPVDAQTEEDNEKWMMWMAEKKGLGSQGKKMD